MLPVPEVAAAAVGFLSPYLAAGATEAAKKLGSAAADRIAGLYDKLKSHLTPSGREALSDLEKVPADPDAQATLRQHLKKQLAAEPALHAELASLVEDLRSSAAGTVLTSAITGDHNLNVQIAGSGNQVGGLDKPS